jgi:GTP-binding protein HflX
LELARLARGLGILVTRTVVQERLHAAPSTLLSEGKLRELAALTGGPGDACSGRAPRSAPRREQTPDAPDYVLFDCTLSAGQQRLLERALGVDVLDRTAVILRIFALRARTRQARLQVELARLLYEAPRIRDDSELADREGGGGRGGRGHSNVELAKQRNRQAIANRRRELEALQAANRARRERRSALPHVALVGYTNAGKSSLMWGLTRREVPVQDELFATVSPTVGALAPESVPRILVSDTVGFLAKLPHELIASFHATLDEARCARLLLVVVDGSDPDFREQLYVTRQTLAQIGAGAVASKLVLNKMDRVPAARREALELEFPDAISMSAHDERDVARLHALLQGHFADSLHDASLVVPYTRGALLSEMHAQAQVVAERFTARGTVVRLRAQPERLARWRQALAMSSRAIDAAARDARVHRAG